MTSRPETNTGKKLHDNSQGRYIYRTMMKVIFMFPMMGGLTLLQLLLQLAVVVVMVTTTTATTNHPLTESFVTADDIPEPLRHPNAYQVRTAWCVSRHVVDRQTNSFESSLSFSLSLSLSLSLDHGASYREEFVFITLALHLLDEWEWNPTSTDAIHLG